MLIEQTPKNEAQKEARQRRRQRRPECIPLGLYFKALKDVFEENSNKMHLFTKIGSHSDWAAHTCKDTSCTHTQRFWQLCLGCVLIFNILCLELTTVTVTLLERET